MLFQNIAKYLLWEIRFRKLDVKGQAALEMANTLIFDTLENFEHKTIEMEILINQDSILNKDIAFLQDYLSDISQLKKVLQLRRFRVKGEIRKLKRLNKLLESKPIFQHTEKEKINERQ